MGKRIVLKLGSSTLAAGTLKLDLPTLARLAKEISSARDSGAEVVVVSSGAILAGSEALDLKTRPKTTQLKQAAAAVGQSRLMRAWEAALLKYDLTAAQILLTGEDLRHRDRYLNARNTIFELLRLGVVPIINENDTVSVDEIKFGDNDVLSALVAGLCEADLLLLFTDQDGVFTADPRKDPSARLLEIYEPGAKVGEAGPSGTGGMASKVKAGLMAADAGVDAVVSNGSRPGSLLDRSGTRFPAKVKRAARRRWLAQATQPKGQIVVDDGARQALVGGNKSLLPTGVKGVQKRFEAGDVVGITAGGKEFARGLTNYGSDDLEKIRGRKTSEIEGLLGHKPADEVVHRDNMALLE